MTDRPDSTDSPDSRSERRRSAGLGRGAPEQGTGEPADRLGSGPESEADGVGDAAAQKQVSGEGTGPGLRAGSVRPAALEPSAHAAKPSLPWRPSDTGHGAGSAATIDVLSEEGLERLARTLAGGCPGDAVYVTRCSWCHRFHVDDWCDAATAAQRLLARDPDLVPTITHGICDTCAAGFEDPR